MMRIEAGAVQLNKEWHPLDEIVGAALSRLEERLRNHDRSYDVSSGFADGAN